MSKSLSFIGKKIKETRIKLGLSQVKLSRMCNIDHLHISRIEKGDFDGVTVKNIEKICNSIGLSFNLLVNEYNFEIEPFVKWAGGKRQILDKICNYLPKKFNTYFEPFVGGGALFLHLKPSVAYINDVNKELIYAFKCFQNRKFYTRMLKILDEHQKNHNENYFLKVRSMDRSIDFKSLPSYTRAARLIYLNKTCFNGLYRVNSKGYFNVPSAKKLKVNCYDKKNMEMLYYYFSHNNIHITNFDFEKAVNKAKAGDFVYFDPPYDTIENKTSFTSYQKEDFGRNEQVRLANVFRKLSDKGVFVMLSNHNTELINKLYNDFNMHIINAKRMINSKADGRGDVEEVIITNY